MAVYRGQKLTGVSGTPDVSLGSLRGGQVARSDRFAAVHAAVDKVLPQGRRVILNLGPCGEIDFEGGLSDANSQADLTPGYVLALSVVCLPSGATQGVVTVSITWTDADGDTTSTTHNLTLPAGPDLSDELWGQIQVKSIPQMIPETMSVLNTREWSRHSRVDVSLTTTGNPRILHACVYETPLRHVLEEDDAADYRVTGYWAAPNADGVGASLKYPVQRFSETTPDGDHRGGTWSLMDTVRAQGLRLGPMLFHWSHPAGRQQTASADTTNWYRVGDNASNSSPMTLVAADQPGFSLTCGGYARLPEENPEESMVNTGSIPVWFCVRGGIQSSETSGDGSFRCRIYTSDYDFVEIDDAFTGHLGSNEEWKIAYGHLRCGKGPGDFVKGTVVFIMDDTAATGFIGLTDVALFKGGQYSRAA